MNQQTYDTMTPDYTQEYKVECYTCEETFISHPVDAAWIEDDKKCMDFCSNHCKQTYKETLTDDEFLAIVGEGWDK